MRRPSLRYSDRGEWLAARAVLATRRLRPLLPVALALFAVVLAAIVLVRVPLADRAARSQRAAVVGTGADADTAMLAARVESAQRLLATRDSLLRDFQFRSEARFASPVLSEAATRTRDSLRTRQAELDAALDRAAKAPLATSYRALAGTAAMRTSAAVQSLVDTLDLLERVRQSLDPAAAPQREFAQLSQRVNAVGSALQSLGRAQQDVLARRIAAVEGEAAQDTSDVPTDSMAIRAARDSAQASVVEAETTLRAARQREQERTAQADSLAQLRAARILGASPLLAAFSALLIGSVLAFTLGVITEARAPTIAHAREAERLTGLPVLATALTFRVPREGRARLQSGTGMDPFRMVYLSLTASGTRHRVICLTGDDTALTTAVVGRLAVSAAGDERATLVMDLAPASPSASRFFGWRDEPGFTDAIAGVRLFREVSRSVGASEGLNLDVIPYGAPRSDADTSIRDATARSEMMQFLSEYDFTVLSAPTDHAVSIAVALGLAPPTIIVVRRAKTKLGDIRERIKHLQAENVNVHGLIILA